jgi:hypothetical protein
MAEVFTTPEGFRDPPSLMDFRLDKGIDIDALGDAEKKWLKELAEWCLTHTDSRSELIGEVIRFPRGDGTANYMVFRTKPLSLLHIPLGDAWDLPDYQMRGLRVKDVRELVKRDRALGELFS